MNDCVLVGSFGPILYATVSMDRSAKQLVGGYEGIVCPRVLRVRGSPVPPRGSIRDAILDCKALSPPRRGGVQSAAGCGCRFIVCAGGAVNGDWTSQVS